MASNYTIEMEQLGMEVALLIASATSKGIDTSIWLGESSNEAQYVTEFTDKLSTLVDSVGLNEDTDTRDELRLAISSESLQIIFHLCDAGFDETGQQRINVAKFLKLCKGKIEKYLSDLKSDMEDEEIDPHDDRLETFPGYGQYDGEQYDEQYNEEQYSKEVSDDSEDNGNFNEDSGASFRRQRYEEYDNQVHDVEEESTNDWEEHGDEKVNAPTDSALSAEFSSLPQPHRLDASVQPTKNLVNKAVSDENNPAVSKRKKRSIISQQTLLIEQMVRNTVRQTDLYHIIQVHFGFIKSTYVMQPARGPIVQCSPRAWLSVSEIQQAFFAARLSLSNSQVIGLMKLVELYSKQYINGTLPWNEQCYAPYSNASSSRRKKAHSSAKDELVKSSVFYNSNSSLKRSCTLQSLAQCPPINSQWLKSYLVYLRVSMRLVTTSSIAVSADKQRQRSKSLTLNAGLTKQPALQSSALMMNSAGVLFKESLKPKPYEEWTEEKLKCSQEILSNKPVEFRRALAGQPHTLTTEEIDKELERYYIIPQKDFDEIVALRVDIWKLDIYGTKDFSHRVHVEKKKLESEQIRQAKGKTVVRPSQAVATQNLVRIKKKLCESKKTEYYQNEEKKSILSKELYWKFDKDVRGSKSSSSPCKWGAWLSSYIEDLKTHIDAYKQDVASRSKHVQFQNYRKHTVAALNEVELKLKQAAGQLQGSYTQLELQKRMNSLRQSALNSATACLSEGKGKNGKPRSTRDMLIAKEELERHLLVTKEEFDRHLGPMLAPHLKNICNVQKNGVGDTLLFTRTPDDDSVPFDVQHEEEQNNSDVLFREDVSQAAKRSLSTEKDEKIRQSENFKEWLQQKEEVLKAQRLAKEQEAASVADAAQKKKAAAAKTFKKWCRLHANQKYLSKNTGVKKSLPATSKVTHGHSWLVEVPKDQAVPSPVVEDAEKVRRKGNSSGAQRRASVRLSSGISPRNKPSANILTTQMTSSSACSVKNIR